MPTGENIRDLWVSGKSQRQMSRVLGASKTTRAKKRRLPAPFCRCVRPSSSGWRVKERALLLSPMYLYFTADESENKEPVGGER